MRKAIKCVWIKRRFCGLSLTTHTGTQRNQSTCLFWTVRSVNPAWISLPPVITAAVRNCNTLICRFEGENLFFLCWYQKKIASLLKLSINRGTLDFESRLQITTGDDTADWKVLVRAIANCRLSELAIILVTCSYDLGARGSVVGWGTMLQAGR
jgi:hypothetical protein